MQWNELNFPMENILLHTFRHLYYLFQNIGHTISEFLMCWKVVLLV